MNFSNFPSEERIKQIKQDVERVKKFKMNSLKIASELTDFVIKVQLEQLKKRHPNATQEELIELLRKQIMESKEKWKVVWKNLRRK
ncbi:MAG: hypothetical protein ACP6IU_11865 [Candidatus Asgardarchaeia archaeon]